MDKKKTTWFIEPIGEHTNQVLSRELPEENAQRDLVDKEGKKT